MKAFRNQDGFSLISALFCVLVLSSMAVQLASSLNHTFKIRRDTDSNAGIQTLFDRVQKIVETEWSCTASLAGRRYDQPIRIVDPVATDRVVAASGMAQAPFWSLADVALREVQPLPDQPGVYTGVLYLEARKEMSRQMGAPVVARSIRNLVFVADGNAVVTRCYPSARTLASVEAACLSLGGAWDATRPLGSQCSRADGASGLGTGATPGASTDVAASAPAPSDAPAATPPLPAASPSPEAVAQAPQTCLPATATLVALPDALATISGNAVAGGDVFLLDHSRLEAVGNAAISGSAYLAAGASFSKTARASVSGVSNTELSGLSRDLAAMGAAAGSLSPSLSLEEIRGTRELRGDRAVNVVAVRGDLALAADEVLTLTGGATDTFVINVTGKITVTGRASIVLQGGLVPERVLFNNLGAGNEIVLAGDGDVAGTFLAQQRGAELSGNGSLSGALVAGGGHGSRLTVSGNGRAIAPRAYCPSRSGR